MASVITDLTQRGLIRPPTWMPANVHYETVMGSVAYGVSDDMSDCDVYGFAMPPKEDLWPHMAGRIAGFGEDPEGFQQFQQHHVKRPDQDRTYDLTIYNIAKYFTLCMACNPNMIDSLFTPRRCVLHSTQVGELVRENRKLFLHKGAWPTFKGYAYAQMTKIDGKQNASNPKRAASIAKHGYDVKFAYHVVRLLCEVEQIMIEHDLDLERNREQLKAIRRGEWSLDQLKAWFTSKEKTLEEVYSKSTLRAEPDRNAIKRLLEQCLEIHYGSLDKMMVRDDRSSMILNDLESILQRYR
jgi:predicted nucleotidyltransferase